MSFRRSIPALVLGLALVGCGSAAPTAAPDPVTSSAAPQGARVMTVYRSPDCSCCHLWADIARAEGWTIATVDIGDMASFKAERGIPVEAASCHTAVIAGYVVEGHVPLAAVERLLAERPAIDGIALPGMPAGSPGMGGVAVGPFEILALDGGTVSVFGSF
jgi:hypothetical protein